MLRRKIRDHEDARQCLAAAAASSMSRKAWAVANGVNPRSLHAWWMNTVARRRSAGESCLRLVELVPADRRELSPPTKNAHFNPTENFRYRGWDFLSDRVPTLKVKGPHA
jgi:hypothetical protein